MTGEARETIFEPTRFRAAIFDLDGTLVHSEHVWDRAKIEVTARYGKRPTRELLDAHVGCGLKGFLDELFGMPLPPEMRRAIGDQIGAEADLWLDRLREPVPGAREWLVSLAEAGLRVAICSSSPRRHIMGALEMLDVTDMVELAVSGAELPPPLKRFAEPGQRRHNGPYLERTLAIAFPPDRSDVEVEVDGTGEAAKPDPLLLKAEGGTLPLTWLADGRPIGTATHRRDLIWQPEARGFFKLSVIDSKGQVDRVTVRLR